LKNNYNISRLAQWCMPRIVCRVPGKNHTFFLSFDDGPHPESTPVLLELLESYSAKAMFFCVGTRAEKHPELIENIRQAGHLVGNHAYTHKKMGWFNSSEYYAGIDKSAEITKSNVFRPPYGFITPAAYRKLLKKYHIVLWDVMPGDFLPQRSGFQLFNIVKAHAKQGSILVFHDSPQHLSSKLVCLELLLSYYIEKLYRFETPDFGNVKT